jgi:hypothetical protein
VAWKDVFDSSPDLAELAAVDIAKDLINDSDGWRDMIDD